MNPNPEFQRNLWLEMTPHRLVAMPAVLGGIFFLVHLMAGDSLMNPLPGVALLLYFALAGLWGARTASEAVVGEIRDGTWDTQRMSSIGPWAMTWGKLLGSTVYPWYGAALCLVVFGVTRGGLGIGDTAEVLLLLLAGGVFAQAVSLLASLQAIRKKLAHSRSAAATYLILGLAASAPFMLAGLVDEHSVHWYGNDYDALNFALVSLLLFLGWAIIAIYRQMRLELQVRNRPSAWMVFVSFLAVYGAGFITVPYANPDQLATVRLFAAYSLILALTYAMAFVERKDGIAVRRLVHYARRRNWRRVLEELPCWFVTMIMVLVYGTVLALRDYPEFHYGANRVDPGVYLLATFLFLLRDMGLILYFNLGRKQARADAAALLYLALLYLLVPGLLSALHLDLLSAMFLPWRAGHSLLTPVSGGVQALLVGWLALHRWRTYYTVRARPVARM